MLRVSVRRIVLWSGYAVSMGWQGVFPGLWACLAGGLCPQERSMRVWMEQEIDQARASLGQLLAQANQVILGKETVVQMAVACLLAGGHLLIEDQPGVGKTTLAHVLARLLGLPFQRIQFTSDLLPADVIGVSVYDRESGRFRFHPGPIFSPMILADEINRATPKSQSALLEAMEERQVTVEGETRALPEPFFVMATQNPLHQIGTFPLPESQLDRFLFCLELGYPARAAERGLLRGEDRRGLIARLPVALPVAQLKCLQMAVGQVHVSEALLDYVQLLLAFSRQDRRLGSGLSPRAGLGLLRAARAWAFIDGRPMVLPEDVRAVLPAVAGHRLRPVAGHADLSRRDMTGLLLEVPIP